MYDSNKYTKSNSNPLKTYLYELKMVSKFGEFLSVSHRSKIDPTHTLKKGFGIVKLQRTAAPFRPIISSLIPEPNKTCRIKLRICR